MENNNLSIKENSELRRDAREQLRGNWLTAVLLCVIYTIVSGILGQIPYLGYPLTMLIAGPFMLGLVSCFMHLVRHEPFMFENLFDGFKKFVPALLLQIIMSIFIFLWSLLLIVPGVIAALSYSMSFYILNDNSEMSAMEALSASKEMMMGYKSKLFMMMLLFAGLSILSVITCFIGMLWITPYMQTSMANFYQNLKENQKTL
ncbi:MAG: DUF975 family protein [Clostridiaceae bacterium]|nr:DUF975 family protein [Clostridiaceae bacterium]